MKKRNGNLPTSSQLNAWMSGVRAITHSVQVFRSGAAVSFNNADIKRITIDTSADSGKFFGFMACKNMTMILKTESTNIQYGDRIILYLTNAGDTVKYPPFMVTKVTSDSAEKSCTVEASDSFYEMYWPSMKKATYKDIKEDMQVYGSATEDYWTFGDFVDGISMGLFDDSTVVSDSSYIANISAQIPISVFVDTEPAASVIQQTFEAFGLYGYVSSAWFDGEEASIVNGTLHIASMAEPASIVPSITGSNYFSFEKGSSVSYVRHDVSANKILKELGSSAVENIDRILANVYYTSYKLDWRGIPWLDFGDRISVDGGSDLFRITNERVVYDGGMRATEEQVMSENSVTMSDNGSLSNVAISGNSSDLIGFFDALYTNAAPTSSFAAQTVSIDLSNYRFVVVQARISTSTAAVVSCIVAVGQTGRLSWTMSGSYGFRDFTVSKTGITFTAGTKGSSANNSYTIPVKVYGIM